MSDTKISPNHYAQLTPQPIEVVEAWNLDHHRASALAYIARAGSKPGESFEDDLNKAIWFLQRAITHQAKQPTPEPTSKWTWSVSVDLKAQPVTEEEPRPDSPIKEPVVQTDEVGEGILPHQKEEWNRKLSLQEAAEKELQAWNCWAEFHNRVQRMSKNTDEYRPALVKDNQLFDEWTEARHRLDEMQTKTLDDTNGVQQVRYFNRPLFPSYLGSNEYDPEVK